MLKRPTEQVMWRVCVSCKREHVCITANEVLVTNKNLHAHSEQNDVGQVLMCGLEHQMQGRKLISCLTTTTRFDILAMQLGSNQRLCKPNQHATCCFKQHSVACSLVMSKTSRRHQMHSSSTHYTAVARHYYTAVDSHYYTAVDSHISRASSINQLQKSQVSQSNRSSARCHE